VAQARRKADLSEVHFERFQFLQQTLSLVYYPLWVVRYGYKGRTYQLVLDGRKVVAGRAPGNPLFQAAALVVAMGVAAALPAELMSQPLLASAFQGQPPFPSGLDAIVPAIAFGLACLAVAWLSAMIMGAGYAFFRRGGERVWGARGGFWDLGRASIPGCLWGLGWLLLAFPGLVLGWPPGFLLPAFALVSLGLLVLGWRLPVGKVPSDEPPGADWLRQVPPQATKPRERAALEPLACTTCAAPLKASEGIAFYLCGNCGQGLVLEPNGLQPIDLSFVAPRPAGRGQRPGNWPFWVFDAQVEIQKREAVETSLLGKERRPSPDRGERWQARAGPWHFYVPAFDGPLHTLAAWGQRLTAAQPDFAPGAPADFEACVRGREEAQKLAEFVFLTIERSRGDVLQKLEYELQLQSPRLLVIPFLGSQ
jgi:hypothetical protein